MIAYSSKFATKTIRSIRFYTSKMQGIPTLAEFLQQQQQQPQLNNNGPKFFIETYGCQMNSNDSQIVASILQQKGYCQTSILKDADIVFINTCSIRANAENRVLQRMTELKQTNKTLGILGCMAERLRQQLFESGADIIVGPDGYKNLPNLLNQFQETHDNQIDTQLSLTETYDDVMPITPTGQTAYVSIMRGCNNMCSFCVVPFTRGRERSRNPESILEEITNLTKQGIREITLLGQNVNSYFYENEAIESTHENSSGFQELYKLRQGNGVRFYYLLDMVAQQFPELRIRFTSPHPKNFPDKVIEIIRKHPNIAKKQPYFYASIHVPIQSGSDVILQKMRRNYTRDAVIQLCQKIRQEIPNCTLSTDVIVGFCDESEQDFQLTMDLMQQIKFENVKSINKQAFMFAYSMREKTHAYRNYTDNVLEEVKQRRLNQLIEMQHSIMLGQNQLQIGKQHLVLVEQHGKKENQLKGRSDTNHLVAFQDNENKYQLGDLAIVEIETAGLKTLQGRAIGKGSIQK